MARGSTTHSARWASPPGSPALGRGLPARASPKVRLASPAHIGVACSREHSTTMLERAAAIAFVSRHRRFHASYARRTSPPPNPRPGVVGAGDRPWARPADRPLTTHRRYARRAHLVTCCAQASCFSYPGHSSTAAADSADRLGPLASVCTARTSSRACWAPPDGAGRSHTARRSDRAERARCGSWRR